MLRAVVLQGATWHAEGARTVEVHPPSYCLGLANDRERAAWSARELTCGMCRHKLMRWCSGKQEEHTETRKTELKSSHKMWEHLQALSVCPPLFLSFDTVYKNKETPEHKAKVYCVAVSQGIHKRLVLSWQGISWLQLVFLPKIVLSLSPFPPPSGCNLTAAQRSTKEIIN